MPDTVPGSGFVEAVMAEDEGAARLGQHPAIVIDLARGKRVSILAAAFIGWLR